MCPSRGESLIAMDKRDTIFRYIRWAVVSLCVLTVLAVLSYWLRRQAYAPDRAVYGYFEIVGSVLAFTFAANALVRFRGKHDRVALLLANGFVLSGVLETYSGLKFAFSPVAAAEGALSTPLVWIVVRTFLAVVMLVALYVEKRLPQPRSPRREMISASVLVVAVIYLTTVFYLAAGSLGLPESVSLQPASSLVPRPRQLLPAALFLMAAMGFHRRLKDTATWFDRAIYIAAGMNAFSHFFASQSELLMDAPAVVAQLLRVSSYAIVLGGALLDNVRLFDQVRQLASSDALTGLANYRRFLDVLNAEMERSGRTRRPFAVVFLDLDGLKRINDTFGHAVGSRAIVRMGDTLRSLCRTVDTAARYGGDEFALILPETTAEAAAYVVQRINARLAEDTESPALSASIGVAVYPQHGNSLEKLLATADKVLYAVKRQQRRKNGRKLKDAAA
jgi:diguanylate cyclase (GGDEF)-like protein